MFDLISDPITEACASWTSWIDTTPCMLNPDTGSGFRTRKRCCGDSDNEIDLCNDDQDVIECTPRECINYQCDCNVQSETFGLKNGVCSGKAPLFIPSLSRKLLNLKFRISQMISDGDNLGELNDTDCGCVAEDCSSECTSNNVFLKS